MRCMFGDGEPTLESLSKPASVAPMKSVTGWSQGLAYKNCSSLEIGNALIGLGKCVFSDISLDERGTQPDFAPSCDSYLVKFVDGVAEGVFGECENLCRRNGEELNFESVGVKELAVTSFVFPATVPL
jgi:hypothetical protein